MCGQDEPVDTLQRGLVDVGVTALSAPLRVKEIPQQALYQEFEELGTDLAQVCVCVRVCVFWEKNGQGRS